MTALTKRYNKYKSGICFYTGMETKLKYKNGDLLATSKEHLVPASTGRKQLLDTANLVCCSRGINSVIGNAPLKVKFALKEALSELTIFPYKTQDEIIKVYVWAAKLFLNTYKIGGKPNLYPWQWNTVSNKLFRQEKRELKRRYMLLLTEEEIKAGFYVK